MRQPTAEKLRLAKSADEILRLLALLIAESDKVNLKSHLTVVELYKWMPDNQHLFAQFGKDTMFEQSPQYAIVDKKTGDSHFSIEVFRLLRDCYDAGGYEVKYDTQELIICEPPDFTRLRAWITAWSGNNEAEAIEKLPDENDRNRFPLPPHPESVLAALTDIMRPLTRQKFERDSKYIKEQMRWQDHVPFSSRTVSDDTLLAIAVLTTERNIESVHRFWQVCQEQKPQLTHPLMPIVHAWLFQQDAKHITSEFDKHRPAAILKQESMGSIRDLVFTRDEGSSVSREIIAGPAPMEEQLTFWSPDVTDSKLPELLPFELYQQGLATTKSAAVAMPVRLAFEALMQMEPGAHIERLYWQLGDLIDCLNPDGKFNWTNQLSYILDGLSALYWLRFPYTPYGEGEVDWIPFLPRAVPNENSTRDSRIIIEVSLPPDVSAHGMMVEKNVVRLLGKKSSARFNAYLAACWLFDHYGTVNGNIIDPTIPKERRNCRGELVDRDGRPILNSAGKPVKKLRSKEAARQLDRHANPGRNKYPILDNGDLIRACYPKGVPREQQREYLRRAKKAWSELESDGFIRIDRVDAGWRIMPSEQHVSLYRALQINR